MLRNIIRTAVSGFARKKMGGHRPVRGAGRPVGPRGAGGTLSRLLRRL